LYFFCRSKPGSKTEEQRGKKKVMDKIEQKAGQRNLNLPLPPPLRLPSEQQFVT
jgi:hypothetical protein